MQPITLQVMESKQHLARLEAHTAKETAMSEATLNTPVVDFAALLKDWRQHRRVSQLGLSSLSGISQRHISFLETGRSRPSRAMVLALADSLDVPLREQNALLQAAGFAPAWSEGPLEGQGTALFQEALQATLETAMAG